MVKRSADGVVVAAAASSCLDVLPSQLHRAPDQPVLGTIENLPRITASQEASRIASNKKQCRLAPAEGPKPLDASALFARARAVLRQPSGSDSGAPIGREQEFEALKEVFEEFTSSGQGSSLYISGLPGTGKSHTVRHTLTALLSASSGSSNRQQAPCLVTWVNCMSVSSASEVYARVAATARAGCNSDWQQDQQQQQEPQQADVHDTLPMHDDVCEGQQQQHHSSSDKLTLSYTALLDCLQQQQHVAAAPSSSSSKSSSATRLKRYRTPRPSSSHSSAARAADAPDAAPAAAAAVQPRRHIVVLDEIDSIAKRSLHDLVQLFKLPYEPQVSLLLVGIANSIDLTERCLPELRLQLVTPRLITFCAYTTKQLAAILEAVVQQLPVKLFDPPALQLCCRSVGASTGDLRHVLKACRAALDDLEQQHAQQQQQQQQQAQQQRQVQPGQGDNDTPAATAPAAPAALPTVGMRHMSAALSRLAGVRSSQFGAQAASVIRSLPNQQQLLLYTLAVFCQQPAQAAGGAADAASEANASSTPGKPPKAAASSLWKGAGGATLLSSSGAGGGGGGGSSSSPAAGSWSGLSSAKKKQKRAAAGAGSNGGVGCGGGGSVFVLAVGAEAAYHQYLQVCKLLKLPSCSKTELLHMADLLAQMALLDIIKAPTAAATSGASGPGFKAGSSHGFSKASPGLKGFRAGGSKGGLGGLVGGGGRVSLGRASSGGAGALGAASAAGAGGAGGGCDVKLSLRASSSEVFGALKHNPALRCLVDV